MMKEYPTLYNLDENNRVRIWYMVQDGARYRTVSGLEDGEKVESGWTEVEGKNGGKKNETTGEEQATKEIEAKYKKKRKIKYFDDKSKVGRSKIFKVMLAATYKDVLEDIRGKDIASQPKLDGIRAIGRNSRSLVSRNGDQFNSVPHVLDALERIHSKHPQFISDGELYNHLFKSDFNRISSLIRNGQEDSIVQSRQLVEYHIYDTVIEGMPFSDRFNFLSKLKKDGLISHPLVLVDTHILPVVPKQDWDETVDYLFQRYLEDGYEGQMIRLLDSVYIGKRDSRLVKRKPFDDMEFEVVELLEGKGNWGGCAKSLTARLASGDTFEASIKGTMEYCASLLKGPCPSHATIRFPNFTPGGKPRFGVAVDLHWGGRKD